MVESVEGFFRQNVPQEQISPAEDFLLTLIGFGEERGFLDQSSELSIEDQLDVIGNEDILNLMSREEIITLTQKFDAIPPEQQEVLLNAVREQSPETFQKIQVGLRFGRSAQGVQ